MVGEQGWWDMLPLRVNDVSEKKRTMLERQAETMLVSAILICALICHWGWQHTVVYTPVFQGGTINGGQIWFSSNLFGLICQCIIFVNSTRFERFFERGSSSIIAACCMEIVSAALLAIVAEGRWGASATIGEMSWLILLVAGFLSSAGVALFVYFFSWSISTCGNWAMRYVVISVATVGGLAAYLVISALPQHLKLLAIAALPIANYLCLKKVYAINDNQSAVVRQTNAKKAFAIDGKSAAYLFVIAAGINFMRKSFEMRGSSSFSTASLATYACIILFIVGLFALAYFCYTRTGLDVRPLCIVCIGFVILLSHIAGVAGPWEILIYAAFFIYVSFLYQFSSSAIATDRQNWCKKIALVFICNGAGLALGALLAEQMISKSGFQSSAYLITALVGISILAFVSIAFQNKMRIKRILPPGRRHDIQSEERLEDGSDVTCDPISLQVIWKKNCNIIANLYRLTPRETEVLCLLAQGKSLNSIAECLHISINTAKSHIAHVYEKIGVHGKEDLWEYFMQADELRRSE